MNRPLAKTLGVAISMIFGISAVGACGAASSLDGESASSSGDAVQGGCSKDADCSDGKLCGFLASDACAAKGVCVAPMDDCVDGCFNATLSCDGTCICFDCLMLPDGYLPKPFPPNPASCDMNVVMN